MNTPTDERTDIRGILANVQGNKLHPSCMVFARDREYWNGVDRGRKIGHVHQMSVYLPA